MRRAIVISAFAANLFAVFTVPCFISGCTTDLDNQEDHRSAALISEGEDPIVSLIDFNVLTHYEAITTFYMSAAGYFYELVLWYASKASRTVALQLRPDRQELIGGTCSFAREAGNGFATGYTALISSHHADWQDSFHTAYRFALPDPFLGADDPTIRRRLYAVGLLGGANEDFDTKIEQEFLNWKFTNYPLSGGNWYQSSASARCGIKSD